MRLLTVVAVASLVAACGSQTPEGASHPRNVVVVAVDAPPGTAAEANWRRFEDNVRVWAPEFNLQLRAGRAAGDPTQRAADAQSGAVQVAALPPGTAVRLVPELGVLSIPGLFESLDEADYVLDEVVLGSFRQLFYAKGLRLLGWIDDGWRDPPAAGIYGSGVIVANRDWYERLTPHDRDVFTQAYGSAGQARADSRSAAPGGDADAGSTDGTAGGDAAAMIQRAGGQSQDIYDLVLRGKQAFAARRAGDAATRPR